jgi:hypothetical protein
VYEKISIAWLFWLLLAGTNAIAYIIGYGKGQIREINRQYAEKQQRNLERKARG